MEITPEIRTRTRTYYETRSATGVLLVFIEQPSPFWACVAATLGAKRVDVVENKMFIEFPTWQEAAAFHDRVFEYDNGNSRILIAAPLPLQEPNTYEEYLNSAIQAHRGRGQVIHRVTYTPMRRQQ